MSHKLLSDSLLIGSCQSDIHLCHGTHSFYKAFRIYEIDSNFKTNNSKSCRILYVSQRTSSTSRATLPAFEIDEAGEAEMSGVTNRSVGDTRLVGYNSARWSSITSRAMSIPNA